MPETTRIRWDLTKYGGFTGYVGTLETWVFQIYRPVLASQGWVLTATFPGALNDIRAGTPDILKAEAERWLEEFTASLGAAFGDAVAADLRSRANELEMMACREPGQERDNLLFSAGLKRAADLIEHGDVPMEAAPAAAGEKE